MPIFSRRWLDQNNPGASDIERLRRQGPVLPVEIAIPTDLATALQASQTPIPPPHVGFALIDTGASITSVDEQMLIGLGMNPTSVATISTPSAVNVQQPVYACILSFPGTPLPPIPFNEVVASSLTALGCSALIGRDILAFCQLVYNGPEGFWTLAF